VIEIADRAEEAIIATFVNVIGAEQKRVFIDCRGFRLPSSARQGISGGKTTRNCIPCFAVTVMGFNPKFSFARGIPD
jgi:hypothetical protein